jgi:hypothetical protein
MGGKIGFFYINVSLFKKGGMWVVRFLRIEAGKCGRGGAWCVFVLVCLTHRFFSSKCCKPSSKA